MNETRLCRMQLTYTFDDYQMLQMMPEAEAPINAESPVDALSHRDYSNVDQCRDIRATGMEVQWSISLEAAVRRIWKQFRRFLLFLCFLLFSAVYFSVDLNPVQMASAWVFTICKLRWSFPVHRICWKVTIELYWSVVGLMGGYNCVCRMIVSFFVSLSFTSPILALAAQEVCTWRGG